MEITHFVRLLQEHQISFFTGVPDSQLKALCDYLYSSIQQENHIIAANEGNAVGIAAGYHLATGKCACVYLQNSGIGNIINPVTSLLSDKVYGIPVLFVVGWRGEPGVHDEPQHACMGEITLRLLEDVGVEYFVLEKTSSETELADALSLFADKFGAGKSCAIVVKKGALLFADDVVYQNENTLKREEIISHILSYAGDDAVVSTTGKTSRELFELREKNHQPHTHDFLTVGSMGHSSSIALGIARSLPGRRVWCIDGDGAVLMHMGSMAVLGTSRCENLVHVVINNSAHESVGGMPTVAGDISLTDIATACGYSLAVSVRSFTALDTVLAEVLVNSGPAFIEVKAAIGSRAELGRPTTTPVENKKALMMYLQEMR